MTSSDSRAYFQELNICEGTGTTLRGTNLSTRGAMIEDSTKKYSVEIVKEISCKCTDCKGIHIKYEILIRAASIEKN